MAKREYSNLFFITTNQGFSEVTMDFMHEASQPILPPDFDFSTTPPNEMPQRLERQLVSGIVMTAQNALNLANAIMQVLDPALNPAQPDENADKSTAHEG